MLSFSSHGKMLSARDRAADYRSGMEHIGRRIARIRNAQRPKLSQAKLAKKLGISSASVAQWELGDTAPHPSRYPAIAEALKVSVAELVAPEDGGSMQRIELLNLFETMDAAEKDDLLRTARRFCGRASAA